MPAQRRTHKADRAQDPANKAERTLTAARASPDGLDFANRAAFGSNAEAAISENPAQAVIAYIGLVGPRSGRRRDFFAEVAATTSRRRAFIVAVVSIDSMTTARIRIARSTGEGNHLFSGCLGTSIEVLG